MTELRETAVNIISEGTRLEGQINFDQISRIHGVLIGEVRANSGSTLILAQTGVVEGNIEADLLIIDGYVRGNISAKTKVVVSQTGRVIGNIKTPSLVMEFGSYFDGKCTMENIHF